MKRLLVYAWAAPVSVAALPIVPFVLASGGTARLVDGVLEVGGGVLGPLLRRAIPGFPIGAITLGHVVLGADARCLEESRGHERVHVAQYERWGMLFPILYVGVERPGASLGRRRLRGQRFRDERRPGWHEQDSSGSRRPPPTIVRRSTKSCAPSRLWTPMPG